MAKQPTTGGTAVESTDGASGSAAGRMVASLESDILFGRLRPRERLVEDTLMDRFDAKRHIVRQALAELERRGIVVKEPHRGCAVRDFSNDEIEEIYELRSLLQDRAAQRIRLPASSDVLLALEAVQRKHDLAVAAQDLRRVDRANEAFHQTLFGSCGNSVLAQAIHHYAYVTRPIRLYPMADPAALERLRCEHWAMIDALRAGDRKALRRLVVAHIQPSKLAYLNVRRLLERAVA